MAKSDVSQKRTTYPTKQALVYHCPYIPFIFCSISETDGHWPKSLLGNVTRVNPLALRQLGTTDFYVSISVCLFFSWQVLVSSLHLAQTFRRSQNKNNEFLCSGPFWGAPLWMENWNSVTILFRPEPRPNVASLIKSSLSLLSLKLTSDKANRSIVGTWYCPKSPLNMPFVSENPQEGENFHLRLNGKASWFSLALSADQCKIFCSRLLWKSVSAITSTLGEC